MRSQLSSDHITTTTTMDLYHDFHAIKPTKLDYFDNMFTYQSNSTLLSSFLDDDYRWALVLDSTIFHPQGGGQPCDVGIISATHSSSDSPGFKFVVQDVRLKDGIVFHYGFFEISEPINVELGVPVSLTVDEPRRRLNSRLHSAGHLLDVCMRDVGLGHLEPGKAYHFPEGPYVEYKGSVPQDELQSKQKELEKEANNLISKGAIISVATLPYDEACKLCGGCLPDYISKDSTPRIVRIGDYPGCPCGGTHVYDISEILSITVSQLRTKKGLTKVFYNVGSWPASEAES
ncbi:uncharacterized protein LOC108197164 [Daucus carota subsp. sativus]|nr:PREDICTED: alanine--tRNA ligase [Daucus carota subsp. sativus]XP_017220186.1 PREDICTED: alanine--tRNA ligase [Daucus carota subsp. sativus]XP_017220187.1 PREDICTED: alanine--tRNA ligase [Daucus carota subsp. sativus]XP_017220188.1 PREDICTED: alanine--tRNA ligase [Daucus carota subsp. sativus]